jgi:hypothetical protein
MTHHAFKFAEYAAFYLAGFAYRFNRGFDLHGLVAMLIIDVATTHPIPRHFIRAAAGASCGASAKSRL